jgi:hypothetical protein
MSLKDRLTPLLRPWGLIWLSIGRMCSTRPLINFLLTQPFHIVVHWQALKEAVRQDGLAALTHPGQIQDAASAKMFSMLCK